MNQHTLTRDEAARLFRLIAYGRGTASNMARALALDRRTCQRLTSPEGLADIVSKLDPQRLDLRTWYALLYSGWHSWGGGYMETSGWHTEARAARELRDDLAILAGEMIGEVMRERMVEDWSRLEGAMYPAPSEYRKALERDSLAIPEGVEKRYHYPAPDPASFTDANGDPL